MTYELRPVINISELENEMFLQYGIDCRGELANFLFDDNYINDCYMSFHFGTLEVFEGKSWQNEEQIRMTNCVKTILQDSLTGYNSCLIDVSW